MLRQFEQQIAEAVIARHHAHVDSSKDRDTRSFLFICRDVVHTNKFLDVHPVRDHESLEAQFVSQNVFEQIAVGVAGDSVHFA